MVGNSVRALEDHRARHVDEALDGVVERGAHDRVVERVVDLGQRVGELVEVGDAADDRRQVDDVRAARGRRRAPRRGRAGRRCGPRSSRASTAAPRAGRRRAPRRRDRASSRRTTAAPIVPAPPVTRTRLMWSAVRTRELGRIGEHLRRAEDVPRVHDQAVAPGELGDRRRASGARSRRGWSRRRRRRRPRPRPRRTASGCDVRVVDRDVGQLALEQPDELVRERVALVVGVALEGEPEHRHLAAGERALEAPLDALDEEQRHRLVHPRDGEQHARRVGALLREGEVLAQAGAGGEAGHRDAAAGVIAVDEVDDLEDVRAVLLAVHHQEVGQREVRVAQDVGPDLRQLGLHRRGLHDRRAEDARTGARRARPSPRRRRR